MKKLILFLLLLPALAWGGEPIEIARMNPYILGGGAAAGCTITSDSAIYGHSGDTATNGMDKYYSAFRIYLASETTVTEYRIKMIMDASNTYDITAWMYSDTPNNGWTDAVPNAVIPGTEVVLTAPKGTTVHDFTLSTPKVLSAGYYWVVVYDPIGGGAPFYNRTLITYVATGSYAYSHSTDGSSWSNLIDAIVSAADVMGCQ